MHRAALHPRPAVTNEVSSACVRSPHSLASATGLKLPSVALGAIGGLAGAAGAGLAARAGLAAAYGPSGITENVAGTGVPTLSGDLGSFRSGTFGDVWSGIPGGSWSGAPVARESWPGTSGIPDIAVHTAPVAVPEPGATGLFALAAIVLIVSQLNRRQRRAIVSTPVGFQASVAERRRPVDCFSR